MCYSSYPPISFALGMFSAFGSPAFLALVFDDGAAVSLHSIRGLMAKLNIRINAATLFDVLQSWDQNFQELQKLVAVLAYDDEAKGYRGNFFEVESVVPNPILHNPRQVFRVNGEQVYSLPATVIGFPSYIFRLPPDIKEARPNLALAAVVGSIKNQANEGQADSIIAGYILALELGLTGKPDLKYNGYPGTVMLGPLFIPYAFSNNFVNQEFSMAMMSNKIQSISIEGWNHRIDREISDLSNKTLLLPGDIILYADTQSPDRNFPSISEVDVIEASNMIFGKLVVNTKI